MQLRSDSTGIGCAGFVIGVECGSSEAASLGRSCLDGFSSQTILGPGAFGQVPYGNYLYRRTVLPFDLVPQFQLIVFTDRWAARMIRLGDWYAALGQADQAASVYQAVLQEVPDNAAAQARLAP